MPDGNQNTDKSAYVRPLSQDTKHFVIQMFWHFFKDHLYWLFHTMIGYSHNCLTFQCDSTHDLGELKRGQAPESDAFQLVPRGIVSYCPCALAPATLVPRYLCELMDLIKVGLIYSCRIANQDCYEIFSLDAENKK